MKKMNNKGFSLVELIVVIAIMAILAVTLAPRLVQYVDKARQASDQEAVNTIFTAAKLANLEAPLGVGATVQLEDTLYTVTDKEWELQTAFTVDASTPEGPQDFFDGMIDILGDFKLEASAAGSATTITLTTDADGKVTVALDYDGVGTGTLGYTVAE